VANLHLNRLGSATFVNDILYLSQSLTDVKRKQLVRATLSFAAIVLAPVTPDRADHQRPEQHNYALYNPCHEVFVSRKRIKFPCDSSLEKRINFEFYNFERLSVWNLYLSPSYAQMFEREVAVSVRFNFWTIAVVLACLFAYSVLRGLDQYLDAQLDPAAYDQSRPSR
jgi:hypothetical protein